MAAAGIGIAFLPDVAVRGAIGDGRLCALPGQREHRVSTQMVWQKERWISPVLAPFLSICREMKS